MSNEYPTQAELFKKYLGRKEKVKVTAKKIKEKFSKRIDKALSKRLSYKRLTKKEPRATLVLRFRRAEIENG